MCLRQQSFAKNGIDGAKAHAGLRQGWVDVEGLAVVLDGRLHVLLVMQSNGKVMVGLGKFGLISMALR